MKRVETVSQKNQAQGDSSRREKDLAYSLGGGRKAIEKPVEEGKLNRKTKPNGSRSKRSDNEQA